MLGQTSMKQALSAVAGRSPVLLLALIGFAGSPALAQHAGYVMFGDANPRAAEVPAEQIFVHPVTAPYFHEDSFVTTDIRAWFLYHDFPKSSAIAGGSAKAAAAQLRVALTDQLQFVAYKDGYIDWDSGAVGDDGMADIAAGLKWNFLQDWDNQLHAAVGVGYEFALGESDVLHDDDEWRLWASVNKGFDRLHLGGTFNAFFADDHNQSGFGNSDRISWHLHSDYYLCEFMSPVVEINGYHVLDRGTETLPFQGVDVVNLGGGAAEPVVSMGVGTEIRPCDHIKMRVAYEFPLTDQNDLFGYRWTASLVWDF